MELLSRTLTEEYHHKARVFARGDKVLSIVYGWYIYVFLLDKEEVNGPQAFVDAAAIAEAMRQLDPDDDMQLEYKWLNNGGAAIRHQWRTKK